MPRHGPIAPIYYSCCQLAAAARVGVGGGGGREREGKKQAAREEQARREGTTVHYHGCISRGGKGRRAEKGWRRDVELMTASRMTFGRQIKVWRPSALGRDCSSDRSLLRPVPSVTPVCTSTVAGATGPGAIQGNTEQAALGVPELPARLIRRLVVIAMAARNARLLRQSNFNPPPLPAALDGAVSEALCWTISAMAR